MQNSIPRKTSRLLHRFIAIFLSICLILSESLGYAAPAQEPALIKIPSSWGKTEETHAGTSGKTLIYIQDAHDSLDAQKNIAKTISHLVEKQGAQTVLEEGFEGPVDSERYFGFIKDAKIKQKVSYFLLDKLRIGGAEYAHINRKNDFDLEGADNLKAHRENLKAYRRNVKSQKRNLRELDAMAVELENMANKFFPAKMKEWIKIKMRYEAGELPLADYLRRIGIHLETIRKMDVKTLIQAISASENKIAHQHLKSERDFQIYRYLKNLSILKRLVQTQLSPQEFEAVLGMIHETKTQDVANFIAKEGGKSLVLSNGWESRLDHAVQFYELTHERDLAVEKALNEWNKTGEKTAVLVFGGFHKNSIHEILKKSGHSFVIVTPKMGAPDERHRAYYKQLMAVGRHEFENHLALAKAASPERGYSWANALPEIQAIERQLLDAPNLPLPQIEKRLSTVHFKSSKPGNGPEDSKISRSETRDLTEEESKRLQPAYSGKEAISFFKNYKQWREANPDKILLVAVRHVESVSNLFDFNQSNLSFSPPTIRGMFQGWTFTNLMLRSGISFGRVISSALERAHFTVAGVSKRQGVPHENLRRLNELIGHPLSGISRHLIMDLYREYIHLLNENPKSFEHPGFSGKDQLRHLEELFAEIEKSDEKDILIGSHGLTLRWIIDILLKIPYEKDGAVFKTIGGSPNVGITAFAYDRTTGQWELLTLYENSYLPEYLRNMKRTSAEILAERVFFYSRAFWRTFLRLFGITGPISLSDYHPFIPPFLSPTKAQEKVVISAYRRLGRIVSERFKSENEEPPTARSESRGRSVEDLSMRKAQNMTPVETVRKIEKMATRKDIFDPQASFFIDIINQDTAKVYIGYGVHAALLPKDEETRTLSFRGHYRPERVKDGQTIPTHLAIKPPYLFEDKFSAAKTIILREHLEEGLYGDLITLARFLLRGGMPAETKIMLHEFETLTLIDQFISRKFGPNLEMTLEQLAGLPMAMDKPILTKTETENLKQYIGDFLTRGKQVTYFEQNPEALLESLLDSSHISIALRPRAQGTQPWQDYLASVFHRYSEVHRNFLNEMDPELRNKIYSEKILTGERGQQIRDFLIHHMHKDLDPDRELTEQGVTLRSVEDRSSGRGLDEGSIVNKIILEKDGVEIPFFLKGFGIGRKGRAGKEERQAHSYESFYFELTKLLGLNSIESHYYANSQDRALLGFTLMEEIRGADTNRLFDLNNTHFTLKEEYAPYQKQLLEEWARLNAIADLIHGGDRRIIQNEHPQYQASYLIDETRLRAGQSALYGIDHNWLFNPDASSPVGDLRKAGQTEMGILGALQDFETDEGKTRLFGEYSRVYIQQWQDILAKHKGIENLTISFFGKDSYEYRILSESLKVSPEFHLGQQWQALLDFKSARSESRQTHFSPANSARPAVDQPRKIFAVERLTYERHDFVELLHILNRYWWLLNSDKETFGFFEKDGQWILTPDRVYQFDDADFAAIKWRAEKLIEERVRQGYLNNDAMIGSGDMQRLADLMAALEIKINIPGLPAANSIHRDPAFLFSPVLYPLSHILTLLRRHANDAFPEDFRLMKHWMRILPDQVVVGVFFSEEWWHEHLKAAGLRATADAYADQTSVFVGANSFSINILLHEFLHILQKARKLNRTIAFYQIIQNLIKNLPGAGPARRALENWEYQAFRVKYLPGHLGYELSAYFYQMAYESDRGFRARDTQTVWGSMAHFIDTVMGLDRTARGRILDAFRSYYLFLTPLIPLPRILQRIEFIDNDFMFPEPDWPQSPSYDKGVNKARQLMGELQIQPREAKGILERWKQNQPNHFIWRYKQDGVRDSSIGYLRSGFFKTFDFFKNAGVIGQWTLAFHASGRNGEGDIIHYLKDHVIDDPRFLMPLNEIQNGLPKYPTPGDRIRRDLTAIGFMSGVRQQLARIARSESRGTENKIYERFKQDIYLSVVQWIDRHGNPHVGDISTQTTYLSPEETGKSKTLEELRLNFWPTKDEIKNNPELKTLGLKGTIPDLPAGGSFGYMILRPFSWNGESALIMTTLQASYGFHHLTKEQKEKYRLWQRALVEKVAEKARDAGIQHFFAKTHNTVRKENPYKPQPGQTAQPNTISDASLIEHYFKPFQKWERTTISTDLEMNVEVWHKSFRSESRVEDWPGQKKLIEQANGFFNWHNRDKEEKNIILRSVGSDLDILIQIDPGGWFISIHPQSFDDPEFLMMSWRRKGDGKFHLVYSDRRGGQHHIKGFEDQNPLLSWEWSPGSNETKPTTGMHFMMTMDKELMRRVPNGFISSHGLPEGRVRGQGPISWKIKFEDADTYRSENRAEELPQWQRQEIFETFVKKHFVNPQTNFDGTLFAPTPARWLPSIFNEIQRKIGPLEKKHFFALGAGNLTDSIAAAYLYQMSVTAVERDPRLSKDAGKTFEAAKTEGLISPEFFQFFPNQDAFNQSWRDEDAVYFFYTQSGGDPQKRSQYRQAFEARLKEKIQEMKPGAIIAILFTRDQLLSRQAEYETLENMLTEQIEISPDHMGGLYLHLYQVPARSEARTAQMAQPGKYQNLSDEKAEELARTVFDALDGNEAQEAFFAPKTFQGFQTRLSETVPVYSDGFKGYVAIQQIGALIYVIAEQMTPQLLSVVRKMLQPQIEQYPNNIILTEKAVYNHHVIELGIYTVHMISAMLKNTKFFENAVVGDFGAGQGVLSQTALALGARKVILTDYSSEHLAQARMLLEDRPYETHVLNFMESASKKELEALSSRTDVALVNIGPWSEYAGANKAVLNALQTDTADWGLILNGGYNADKEYHSPQLNQNYDAFRNLGNQTDILSVDHSRILEVKTGGLSGHLLRRIERASQERSEVRTAENYFDESRRAAVKTLILSASSTGISWPIINAGPILPLLLEHQKSFPNLENIYIVNDKTGKPNLFEIFNFSDGKNINVEKLTKDEIEIRLAGTSQESAVLISTLPRQNAEEARGEFLGFKNLRPDTLVFHHKYPVQLYIKGEQTQTIPQNRAAIYEARQKLALEKMGFPEILDFEFPEEAYSPLLRQEIKTMEASLRRQWGIADTDPLPFFVLWNPWHGSGSSRGMEKIEAPLLRAVNDMGIPVAVLGGHTAKYQSLAKESRNSIPPRYKAGIADTSDVIKLAAAVHLTGRNGLYLYVGALSGTFHLGEFMDMPSIVFLRMADRGFVLPYLVLNRKTERIFYDSETQNIQPILAKIQQYQHRPQFDSFVNRINEEQQKLPADFVRIKISYQFVTQDEARKHFEGSGIDDEVVSMVLDTYRDQGFMMGAEDYTNRTAQYWIDPSSENFRFTALLNKISIAINNFSGVYDQRDMQAAIQTLERRAGGKVTKTQPIVSVQQIENWQRLIEEFQAVDFQSRSEARFSQSEIDELNRRLKILKDGWKHLDKPAKEMLLEPSFFLMMLGVKPGYFKSTPEEPSPNKFFGKVTEHFQDIMDVSAYLNYPFAFSNAKAATTIYENRELLRSEGFELSDDYMEAFKRYSEDPEAFDPRFLVEYIYGIFQQSVKSDRKLDIFMGLLSGYPAKDVLEYVNINGRALAQQDKLEEQMDSLKTEFRKVYFFMRKSGSPEAVQLKEQYAAALYYAYGQLRDLPEFKNIADRINLPEKIHTQEVTSLKAVRSETRNFLDEKTNALVEELWKQVKTLTAETPEVKALQELGFDVLAGNKIQLLHAVFELFKQKNHWHRTLNPDAKDSLYAAIQNSVDNMRQHRGDIPWGQEQGVLLLRKLEKQPYVQLIYLDNGPGFVNRDTGERVPLRMAVKQGVPGQSLGGENTGFLGIGVTILVNKGHNVMYREYHQDTASNQTAGYQWRKFTAPDGEVTIIADEPIQPFGLTSGTQIIWEGVYTSSKKISEAAGGTVSISHPPAKVQAPSYRPTLMSETSLLREARLNRYADFLTHEGFTSASARVIVRELESFHTSLYPEPIALHDHTKFMLEFLRALAFSRDEKQQLLALTDESQIRELTYDLADGYVFDSENKMHVEFVRHEAENGTDNRSELRDLETALDEAAAEIREILHARFGIEDASGVEIHLVGGAKYLNTLDRPDWDIAIVDPVNADAEKFAMIVTETLKKKGIISDYVREDEEDAHDRGVLAHYSYSVNGKTVEADFFRHHSMDNLVFNLLVAIKYRLNSAPDVKTIIQAEYFLGNETNYQAMLQDFSNLQTMDFIRKWYSRIEELKNIQGDDRILLQLTEKVRSRSENRELQNGKLEWIEEDDLKLSGIFGEKIQNANIAWTDKQGAAHTAVVIAESAMTESSAEELQMSKEWIITLMPGREELLNRMPVLKTLATRASLPGLPALLSFGNIILREYEWKGEPVLLIRNVQSSRGYQHLTPEQKEEYPWKTLLLNKIIEAAKEAGYRHIFVKSHHEIRRENPIVSAQLSQYGVISQESLYEHYIKPFRKSWKLMTMRDGGLSKEFWHLNLQSSRSETRSIPDWLTQVYEKAGLKDPSAEDEIHWELGVHLPTPVEFHEAIIETLGIKPDKPYFLLSAGSGRFHFELRLLHRFPNLRIVGIEAHQELHEKAAKLMNAAIELGAISSEQAVLFNGNFNQPEFAKYFEEANGIYYYELGTNQPDLLAQTIASNFKSGRVVVFGSTGQSVTLAGYRDLVNLTKNGFVLRKNEREPNVVFYERGATNVSSMLSIKYKTLKSFETWFTDYMVPIMENNLGIYTNDAFDHWFLTRPLGHMLPNAFDAVVIRALEPNVPADYRGTVGIKVTLTPQRVVQVKLWDNGTGMQDEILQRIFTQLGVSTKQTAEMNKLRENGLIFGGKGEGLYKANQFLWGHSNAAITVKTIDASGQGRQRFITPANGASSFRVLDAAEAKALEDAGIKTMVEFEYPLKRPKYGAVKRDIVLAEDTWQLPADFASSEEVRTVLRSEMRQGVSEIQFEAGLKEKEIQNSQETVLFEGDYDSALTFFANKWEWLDALKSISESDRKILRTIIYELIGNAYRTGRRSVRKDRPPNILVQITLMQSESRLILKMKMMQESSLDEDWERLKINGKEFESKGPSHLYDLKRREILKAAQVHGGGGLAWMGKWMDKNPSTLIYRRSQTASHPVETVFYTKLRSEGRQSVSNGTFLMDANVLAGMNAGQKDELFSTLYKRRSEFRLVLFNEKGQLPHMDRAINAILKLDNVKVSPEGSYQAAADKYAYPGARRILFVRPGEEPHFPQGALVQGVLLREQPGVILFGERLLQEEVPFGVSQENGVFDPPTDVLAALTEEHFAHRIIAYAA